MMRPKIKSVGEGRVQHFSSLEIGIRFFVQMVKAIWITALASDKGSPSYCGGNPPSKYAKCVEGSLRSGGSQAACQR